MALDDGQQCEFLSLLYSYMLVHKHRYYFQKTRFLFLCEYYIYHSTFWLLSIFSKFFTWLALHNQIKLEWICHVYLRPAVHVQISLLSYIWQLCILITLQQPHMANAFISFYSNNRSANFVFQVVNRIQKLRKKAGLEPTDLVEVYYKSLDTDQAVLENILHSQVCTNNLAYFLFMIFMP